MNKTVKGSLAGAAGVALLMGGFGSYALWSQDATLGSSHVQSGHLTIATTPGSYADVNHANVPWAAGDLMVPGDQVTYTQVFAVTGTGKNLKGTIALAPSAMNPNTFSDQLTRSVDVTSSVGDAAIHKVDATHFTFSAPFNSANLTATVTYTLASAVSGTNDQDKGATTPDSTFTIAQTTGN
jgi:alternate signal-mediated exported protein